MIEFSNTKHGEVLYQAVIPIDPKTKKNNMCIKYKKTAAGYKPYISQSDMYLQFERDCGYFLRKIPKAIDVPVNVRMVFYRETNRRVDLCNLENAILDILVKYGILADDNINIVASMDGSRVLHDKEKPRTEITIERTEQ